MRDRRAKPWRKEVDLSNSRPAHHRPRIILGIAAMIAGLLLTLRNLGVAGIDDLLDYWPIALVALGLAMTVRPRGVSGRGTGMVLAVIGAWLLLRNLGVVSGDLWDLWPLFLVFAGGSLVWHAIRGRRASSSGSGDDHDDLSAFSCLSGAVHRSTSNSFRGAELTSVMGGCEIDLTRASIGEGEAHIDVFTWWGGIEIRVPAAWTVSNQVTPILGRVVDKTESSQTDPKQRLVVRGVAIMGGVEIRH